ncbi:MAG: putative acyltransferase [Ilumatobacteraceae bacterium]|nr:putative acyltransferase [Ilumatobacteraceae bacterium]
MTVDVERRLRAYVMTLDHAIDARRESAPDVDRRTRRPAMSAVRPSRARVLVACACVVAVAAIVIVAVSVGRPDHRSLTALTTVAADTTATTGPLASTAPSVAPSAVPAEPTTTSTPASTVPQKPVLDTLAIGESVMQGALTQQLASRGVTVDAREGLQARGMIEVLRADLDKYTVTNAVVIQVGTNGTVTQAEYDQLANMVAAYQHVYFLTVKAPKSLIDVDNALIKALPASHPNVTVVDWEALGNTIESELSSSDGYVHLKTSSARRDYSNLILGALGKPLIPDPTVITTR